MPDTGTLKVQVFKGESYVPIDNAKVTVVQKKEDSNRQIGEVTTTDSSGLTTEVVLSAPPKDNSEKPSDKLPYSFCDVKVEAEGFETFFVKNCQIYPNTTALQECKLKEVGRGHRQEEVIQVQPNTLVGDYPPKIPEDENKKLPPPPSGFVVLPEPVVPGLIVVHEGSPNDPTAPNYTVRYKDYIKNVASSEIFATWPDTTIRANIYCIISFTLNRIYTEWYRGKGKNFDITSSTAFDHAFTYGRNIYSNISRIVDQIFSTYVKRWGREQPLFTQYCDGVKVQCPGWLTQWGSKYLGDKGKAPYEILTNFYGTNIEFKRAKKVSGIPRSWPGYVLKLGSSGAPVRTVQTYLNRISQNYPAIPKVRVDGVYGEGTKEQVKIFQGIFGLPKSGAVNYPTWYKISDVYVAVTKIAELRGENVEKRILIPHTPYKNVIDIPTIQYPYGY
jgi:peptidoglycan hydrolase-like protein with peptidoglycan-binding domain